MLDDLNSLVIQFVLQGERLLVASLEVFLPTIVDTTWEHKLHLRDLSQVVLLVLDDTDYVLLAAFTESIHRWILIVRNLGKFFIPQFLVKLDEVTIVSIFGFHGLV